MDNFRKCIDIVFRQIHSDDVINCIYNKNNNRKCFTNANEINKELFINLAFKEFRQYSENEICNLYNKLNDEWMQDSRMLCNNNKSIFNLLIGFDEDILVEKEGIPQCKYNQILRWRETFNQIGQDIFTTSFLAYRDCLTAKNRTYFQWSPIISTDNIRLHNIMERGLCENHFHLKGSAPTWNLTWINLMNNVVKRKKEFIDSGMLDRRLEPEYNFNGNLYRNDYYILFKVAAVIRAYLFSIINNTYLFYEDKNEDKKMLQKYITDDFYMQNNVTNLQGDINNLRIQFGKRYNTRTKLGYIIDYAITTNMTDDKILINHYFCGERYFLYSMFKKIYSNNIDDLDQANLFYAYLLIKSKLRHEFIQSNTRVGFKNFADYQDRKTIFLKNNSVFYEAVFTTAINGSMNNQCISSLEARVTPEDNPYKLSRILDNIDKIVRYTNNDDLNYYYVLHFIKLQDKTDLEDESLFLNPRHYSLRNKVRRTAIATVKMRNAGLNNSDKIYGIDSCSNEIGCRPEVFAQAFRYFRSSATDTSNYNSLGLNEKRPTLKATYHVGEDFLDITDGLRAIDEAIHFLNLSSGDRIGHAIALGTDVARWYEFKNRTLLISKQDYLDNIVWLLIKIKEFNIEDMKNFIFELEEKYYQMFVYIYQENFNNEYKNKYCSYRTYYDSWRLRGNDPMLYFNTPYKEKQELDEWKCCAINNTFPKEKYVREDEDVQFLYSNYHFNSKVKKKGKEIIEFKVTDDYIKAVKRVQKEMQFYVMRLGIGIETNPSSNSLISTFKKYDKHPIVNMYNLGLELNQEKKENCAQLFVSINTDDQGIFDTSLENEYALLALALEKAKDEKGNYKYNPQMIYDWLDRIRRMGFEQRFKGKDK